MSLLLYNNLDAIFQYRTSSAWIYSKTAENNEHNRTFHHTLHSRLHIIVSTVQYLKYLSGSSYTFIERL